MHQLMSRLLDKFLCTGRNRTLEIFEHGGARSQRDNRNLGQYGRTATLKMLLSFQAHLYGHIAPWTESHVL